LPHNNNLCPRIINLKNRLDKLERGYPKHWTVKSITDDELAQLITGNPDAKASDLTDDILRKLILEPVDRFLKEIGVKQVDSQSGLSFNQAEPAG